MSLPEARRQTRLDPYRELYARRTVGLKASAVRSLFAVANQPQVVSLAGGMPNIVDLPLDLVADSAQRLIRDRGPQVLQYNNAQGEERLRQQICQVMAVEQIQADPDDVVLACGSQQALDLLTRTFVEPGDVVLAEGPSYVGALNTFQAYQAQVVHVAIDQYGLIPEALRQAVLACRSAGRKVKFCYTIPNFSNPSGATQTVKRRQGVLAVAREVGLLLVEDNPYGLLCLDWAPRPALRSLEAEQVVYLGSFSKTLAPGLRIGWALAPHAIKEKLLLAQEAATLCPPVFSQFLISDYLEQWDWLGQIEVFRQMYRLRRAALLEGLAEHMPPGVSWTKPGGGFFVWLTLPRGLDSQAMLAQALTNRVAYVPGTGFYADGLGSRNIRLSFCFPPPDRIREGARRLGEVIRDALGVAQTFGLTAPDGGGLDGGGPDTGGPGGGVPDPISPDPSGPNPISPDTISPDTGDPNPTDQDTTDQELP